MDCIHLCRENWRNPNTNNHQACHQPLQAYSQRNVLQMYFIKMLIAFTVSPIFLYPSSTDRSTHASLKEITFEENSNLAAHSPWNVAVKWSWWKGLWCIHVFKWVSFNITLTMIFSKPIPAPAAGSSRGAPRRGGCPRDTRGTACRPPDPGTERK